MGIGAQSKSSVAAKLSPEESGKGEREPARPSAVVGGQPAGRGTRRRTTRGLGEGAPERWKRGSAREGWMRNKGQFRGPKTKNHPGWAGHVWSPALGQALPGVP